MDIFFHPRGDFPWADSEDLPRQPTACFLLVHPGSRFEKELQDTWIRQCLEMGGGVLFASPSVGYTQSIRATLRNTRVDCLLERVDRENPPAMLIAFLEEVAKLELGAEIPW